MKTCITLIGGKYSARKTTTKILIKKPMFGFWKKANIYMKVVSKAISKLI